MGKPYQNNFLVLWIRIYEKGKAALQLRGKYLIAVAAKGALANFQKLLPIGKKMLSNSISPLNGTRQMSRRFAIQSVCDIELKAFHDFIFWPKKEKQNGFSFSLFFLLAFNFINGQESWSKEGFGNCSRKPLTIGWAWRRLGKVTTSSMKVEKAGQQIEQNNHFVRSHHHSGSTTNSTHTSKPAWRRSSSFFADAVSPKNMLQFSEKKNLALLLRLLPFSILHYKALF